MGINTWEGVEWLDRDRFEDLLEWVVRLEAIEKGSAPDRTRVARLIAAAAASGYRIDALRVALAGPATPAGRTARPSTASRRTTRKD